LTSRKKYLRETGKMIEYANKRPTLLIRLAATGAILSFLALIVVHSLAWSVNIPTFHLDGAFQTASGMFRLDAGQLPGRDFFPYLGIGPLLLIFPFFKMAGANLAASVFSAKFITLSLGWIAVSVLFHLIFRPAKIFSLAAGAALFSLLSLVPVSSYLFDVFNFAREPGNSLRPIRAGAPYLVAIFSYLLLQQPQGRRRDIMAGLLVGASLLWSNDFAIPTASLTAVFFLGVLWLTEKPTWHKSMRIVLITAISSWAAMLLLITGGHPLELIKYNFVDVANDQWWYFSSYRESNRIFEASQITRIISEQNYFPLCVLVSVLLCAAKTRKVELALLSWIGIALFAGGAVASAGGQLGKYFGGFNYWGAVTATLLALRALQLLVSRAIQTTPGAANAIQAWLLVIAFGALFASVAGQWINYRQESELAENDSGRFYVPEFGGYLATEWKGYINYARNHKDSKVIEEYWGVLSSLNRSFPSWPVDAAIHALGGVRQTAKSRLANADLLVTTRFSTGQGWQQWSLSQNFWFYEEVLSRREPDFVSPTTIVWRKSGKERKYSAVACNVANDGGGFTLASEASGFYAVTVNYRARGAGRYLLMQKNNLSLPGDGYVSLPIGGSTATIPVFKTAKAGSFFDFKVVGNSTVTASITSCFAKRITYENDETLHAPTADSFYLTDSSWVHGISRRFAEFILPNEDKYLTSYRPGRYVSFKNGEARKILTAVPAGQYLRIALEGAPLDPAVGLPSEFQVLDFAAAAQQMSFLVTDDNWDRGVARSWAGFIVPNTASYARDFMVGNYVKLGNGDTRKVVDVKPAGKYLNVYVEGEILIPGLVGVPSRYVGLAQQAKGKP
jgi:hypothetical protein